MNVLLNDREVNFDICVSLMDDEIREELHQELVPCSDQEFLDAYIIAHKKKYNEDFDI